MIVDSTFVYWATERENVRKNREEGLPREQWTNDPIMAGFRFCNVSREDDRTTVWIKENLRDPWDQNSDSDEELFRVIAMSRFLNLPESLGLLTSQGVITPDTPIDWHDVHDTLQSYKDDDDKNRVFSGAYMVGAPPNERTYEFGTEKVAYMCGVLNAAKLPTERTRQGFVEALTKQFGFGEFMSGQIAADLAYTRILRDAPDHRTWAPRGPGAMRGMNRALGLNPNRAIPVAEYLEIGKLQMSMLPEEIVEGRSLTLHDVASNVNCETSKYLGMRDDGKKPKRKF